MKYITLLSFLISGVLSAEILKVPQSSMRNVSFFNTQFTMIVNAQYKRFYSIGKRVIAKYPTKLIPVVNQLADSLFAGKYWYLGTIRQVDISEISVCRIFIAYDDGDKSWVPCHFAMPFNTFSGMTKAERDSFYERPVLARYYDSGTNIKYWYRAKVARLENGKYYIVYADGDKKLHTDMSTIAQATFFPE